MKIGLAPKLFLNRSTTPDFLLTFLLHYLWWVVGGLEGRMNHLRALIKVGSEKSKGYKYILKAKHILEDILALVIQNHGPSEDNYRCL